MLGAANNYLQAGNLAARRACCGFFDVAGIPDDTRAACMYHGQSEITKVNQNN
jgi:hypothetical protein